jgi:hypothetical protein
MALGKCGKPKKEKAMKRFASMLLATALLICVGQASAELIITFAQSGANVVANGTGSLNFGGLSFQGFDINSSYVNASAGALLLGSSGTYADYFGNISGPTTFGSGGNVFATSSTTTAPNNTGAGVSGATGQVLVPGGYGAGNPFTVSATWNNTTISGLGLTPGTYVWTWASDDLKVVIPGSVPEPSSLILLGSGALGLLGVVGRKILG